MYIFSGKPEIDVITPAVNENEALTGKLVFLGTRVQVESNFGLQSLWLLLGVPLDLLQLLLAPIYHRDHDSWREKGEGLCQPHWTITDRLDLQS